MNYLFFTDKDIQGFSSSYIHSDITYSMETLPNLHNHPISPISEMLTKLWSQRASATAQILLFDQRSKQYGRDFLSIHLTENAEK